MHGNAPLFIRSGLYFLVRYVFRGEFLDGISDLIYHVLHGFWFRFYVDACCHALQQREKLTLERNLVA